MQGKRQGRQGSWGSQGGGGQLQQSHVKIHTVIMWQTKTIDKRPKARSGGGRGRPTGYGTSLNRRRGAFPPVSQPATPPALPSGAAEAGEDCLFFTHVCQQQEKQSERKKSAKSEPEI